MRQTGPRKAWMRCAAGNIFPETIFVMPENGRFGIKAIRRPTITRDAAVNHAVVVVDGTEIDPNTFYDRCGSILHLVRAVGVASREAEPSDVDSWATHDACMGIAALAESLEQDLNGYFRSVTTTPRETGTPKEAAAEEARPAAMRPPLSPRSKRVVNELLAELVDELSHGRARVTASPKSADLHNGSGESSDVSAQH